MSEVLDENVLMSIMKKENSGKSKGPCPIKCGRNHINSSLFFVESIGKIPQSGDLP